ncbi:hypothetical protein K523DRAFT_366780, partial [Schizophyllum commune Tattone D]
MSTNATSAGEDAERLVRYIIHHSPGNDVLPKFKKETRRCKIKSFQKRGPPARRSYAVLSVGNVSHRCDLGIEQSWEFVAPCNSTLLIDLYVEDKKGSIRIATTRRELASLVNASAQSSKGVPLDVCSKKVVNDPSVELIVTLESLTTHDATETTPAPGQSSVAEDPRGAISDESSRVSTPEPLSESVGAEFAAVRTYLSIPEKWDTLERYARTVVGIGSAVAEINPIAQAVFALLDLGTKEIEKRREYHDDIHSLIDQANEVCETAIKSYKRGFKEKRPEQLE